MVATTWNCHIGLYRTYRLLLSKFTFCRYRASLSVLRRPSSSLAVRRVRGTIEHQTYVCSMKKESSLVLSCLGVTILTACWSRWESPVIANRCISIIISRSIFGSFSPLLVLVLAWKLIASADSIMMFTPNNLNIAVLLVFKSSFLLSRILILSMYAATVALQPSLT